MADKILDLVREIDRLQTQLNKYRDNEQEKETDWFVGNFPVDQEIDYRVFYTEENNRPEWYIHNTATDRWRVNRIVVSNRENDEFRVQKKYVNYKDLPFNVIQNEREGKEWKPLDDISEEFKSYAIGTDYTSANSTTKYIYKPIEDKFYFMPENSNNYMPVESEKVPSSVYERLGIYNSQAGVAGQFAGVDSYEEYRANQELLEQSPGDVVPKDWVNPLLRKEMRSYQNPNYKHTLGEWERTDNGKWKLKQIGSSKNQLVLPEGYEPWEYERDMYTIRNKKIITYGNRSYFMNKSGSKITDIDPRFSRDISAMNYKRYLDGLLGT